MTIAKRPSLFIGSSTENLPVANTLQSLLDHDAEVEVWTQGTFAPGKSVLESLVEGARRADFAVLVVSAEDTAVSRGKRKNVPRNNVIFELGVFVGMLGPERSFMLHDRSVSPDLPSDLAGVVPVTYALHSNGDPRTVARSGRNDTTKRNFRARAARRPRKRNGRPRRERP